MNSSDTIVAISSAAGAAARMIVRLRGPDAFAIAANVTSDELHAGSRHAHAALRSADLLVPARLYALPRPAQLHRRRPGRVPHPRQPAPRPYAARRPPRSGARPAEPGEFTARAYFNGRLDLAEAEGVAATIAASNERELSAARQLLAGELSRRLQAADGRRWSKRWRWSRRGSTFPTKDISFISPDDLLGRIDCVDATARLPARRHRPFRAPGARAASSCWSAGPTPARARCSTRWPGAERAVVSPIAGTTRDALSAEVTLPGGMARLVDVAGLEPEEASAADVERQMTERAHQMAKSADVLVLVRDVTDPLPPIATSRPADLSVLTKVDLDPHVAIDNYDVAVSAVSGTGLAEFLRALSRLCFGDTSSGGTTFLALNARHVQCVSDGRGALDSARIVTAAGGGPELIAHHLRDALDALGGVFGGRHARRGPRPRLFRVLYRQVAVTRGLARLILVVTASLPRATMPD